MRLLILGATGRTGRELVTLARVAGHEVTAFARRPAALVAGGSGLRVLRGDLTDPESIAQAVAGQEIVLSALGSPTWRPNTVLSDGIGYVLAAMRRHRVRRFLCMSALGVGETRGQLGPLYNFFLIPFMLRYIFAEKERLEGRMLENELEWTIVRPGTLTNGPGRGRYQAALHDVRPPLFPRISRADVAAFMMRDLTERRFVRQAVGLWDL